MDNVLNEIRNRGRKMCEYLQHMWIQVYENGDIIKSGDYQSRHFGGILHDVKVYEGLFHFFLRHEEEQGKWQYFVIIDREYDYYKNSLLHYKTVEDDWHEQRELITPFVLIIQRQFRKSLYNPEYKLCRDIMRRKFAE